MNKFSITKCTYFECHCRYLSFYCWVHSDAFLEDLLKLMLCKRFSILFIWINSVAMRGNFFSSTISTYPIRTSFLHIAQLINHYSRYSVIRRGTRAMLSYSEGQVQLLMWSNSSNEWNLKFDINYRRFICLINIYIFEKYLCEISHHVTEVINILKIDLIGCEKFVCLKKQYNNNINKYCNDK